MVFLTLICYILLEATLRIEMAQIMIKAFSDREVVQVAEWACVASGSD